MVSRGGGDGLMADEPVLELRLGIAIAVLFFVLFLGWSLFARLDAAANAQGTITVEGHRQSVQHKEGGIIAAINVHEGSRVKAGDVLISLAPAEVEAQERSMAWQVIDLQAERARLFAEQRGESSIGIPVEFAQLTGADKAEADRALHAQQGELVARARALGGQKAVLRQRGSQLEKAIEGYHNQISATDTQSKLINDELNGTKGLAARGYASENRVRALEREDAGLSSQRADLAANAARSQAQIGETQMQALSLQTDRAEGVAKDLRETEFQLNDLLPKLAAVKEQLAKMQIRAPVGGQVVGLDIFTVGGVIAPGQKLMDIVPDHEPMVIEAQMTPNNTDGVYVGQQAEVRLISLHDRGLPILKGTITRLSADSFVDEKTGVRYYTCEISVPETEVRKLAELRGESGGLRVGLPVQVVIPLRKRTAFQYLTEPLTQAFSQSFREQ
jgi:HlyD family secretion protein